MFTSSRRPNSARRLLRLVAIIAILSVLSMPLCPALQASVAASTQWSQNHSVNGFTAPSFAAIQTKLHQENREQQQRLYNLRPADIASQRTFSESPSLLDVDASLTHPISSRERQTWITELNEEHPSANRAALLHIWLGEYALAQDEQPEQAGWQFRTARKLVKSTDPLNGLAQYDEALSTYYSGWLGDAAHAFYGLLVHKPALTGFDRRSCVLWWRQASAHASYHADHAKLSIPEPTRLDPYCAAAALATSLRHLGLPYDKAHVLKEIRVTGEGSTLQDVVKAASKMGLSVRPVHANDDGLIALPKPLVAYVEHDHFIAVIGANKHGVTYLCSDCGAWPGGEVHLSWKQWHAMDAIAYAAVVVPGSHADSRITQLLVHHGQTRPTLRVAMAGALTGLHLQILSQLHPFVQLLSSQAVLSCNPKPTSASQPPYGSPPTDGEPVMVSSGEEESYCPPDLVVYNPKGPSVVWQRVYDSLRGGSNAGSEDYDAGMGWSNPYTVHVIQPTGTPLTGYVVYPNGSQTSFTATAAPTSTNPTVQCTVHAGAPILVTWSYSSSSSSGIFTVMFADRTQWITGGFGDVFGQPVTQIKDRNGNSIYLAWSNTSYNEYILGAITTGPNQTGTMLLVFQRNPNYSLYEIDDCYGRSVYYSWDNTNLVINGVSQVLPTGTLSPGIDGVVIPSNDLRFSYSYMVPTNTGPFLQTVMCPSPTGSGNSTMTINYNPTTYTVASTVDGNGNKRAYTAVDGTHEKVTVTNSGGQTAYSYTTGWDSNMNQTTVTNGNGTVVSTATYADPNDPYRPSSFQDGNGNVWTYTWDQYGNLKTVTTPRQITTTNSYSYSNFAMGEVTSVQQGTKAAATLTYYEPSGLINTVKAPLPGTTGGSSTANTSFTWDSLGNVLTVARPGNNAASSITTTFNYTTDGTYNQADAIGQPITITNNLGYVSHLRYDSQDNLKSYVDPLGNETDYTVNIANQPLQTSFPATGQSGSGRGYVLNTYLWPGGPTTAVTTYNESGTQVAKAQYGLGQEGELLSVGGSATPLTYTYDAIYRLASIADGNGHKTTYSYSTAGYLNQIVYPGAGGTTQGSPDTVTFPSYDNDGNPLKRFDGNNVETDYTYSDAESKLTKVHYPGGQLADTNAGYDTYGRLSTISNGVDSHTYTFDDQNELLSDTTSFTGGPQNEEITYGYYPNSSRESMVTPAGSFSYNYDANGRISNEGNPFSETSSWTYLNNGWLKTQTLGNGTVTTYTRNALGEVTDLVNKTSGATTLSDYGSMAYNGLAALTSLTASLPADTTLNGTTNYTYDSISGTGSRDQLTQEASGRNGGYTNTFAYDSGSYTASSGVGNSTTFRGGTNTFNADNQLSNSGFVYDGNGNPTTYSGTTLTFDPENHFKAQGSTVSATYNAAGLRGTKTNSSGTTYYLYDGTTPICELSSAGAVTATNTFGGAGLLSRNASSESTFYTFDPQGNLAQRLNSSQSVLTSHIYDSFGNGASSGSFSDPFGFGAQWGYYTDHENGLVLCTNRYYDSAKGRWLTRDPLGYGGGANLYGYCGNSPMNAIDPSGLDFSVGV